MRKLFIGLAGGMLAVVMACVMLLLGPTARPALAYEGTGAPDDPYRVSSLQDLKDALPRGGSVQLAESFDVNYGCSVSASSDINADLDLNGHTIRATSSLANTQALVLNDHVHLTIRDGSTTGGGAIDADQAGIEAGGGSSLELQSGAIRAKAGSGVQVSGGTFSMSGGTVNADAGGGVQVSAGTFNLSGGTVSGGDYGVFASGATILNGGTISGSNVAVSGSSVTNVAGIGWADVAGTQGREAIEASARHHELGNTFKKVQFPSYSVIVDGGTATPSPALQGETITVTADTSTSGKVFDKWTTSDGVTFAKQTDAQTTFTMPANNVSATATYKYKIEASTNTDQGGEVSGAGTYASGQSVTLAATPAEDYVFDCWTEGADRVKDKDGRDAKATYTFTVERARTLVANFRKVEIRTAIEDQTYAGKPIEPDIPAKDVSFDGVDYAVQDKDYTVSYENNVHAGTASVILTFAGDFTGTARKTFAIKQAPLRVSAASATRPYDGTSLTASYASEGLVEGDSISSADVTGSQTNVGKSACEVRGVAIENETYGTTTDDYKITYEPGTLEVTPYSKKVTVKITGHSSTHAYDGEEHEVSGYDAIPDVDFYAARDYTFKGTASAKGTKVGVYPMGLSDKDFSNESENFTNVVFEVTDGKLTIGGSAEATLIFDLAGGTLDGATGTYTMAAGVGSTVKLPQAPARDGYRFKYWKGSEYAAGAPYEVTGDHTFTATWERITYTISFEANGGSGSMDKMTVEAGESATLTANKFTRSGYTFNGWNTAKDGKGTAYANKATLTPTGDLVLHAQWTKNATASSATKSSTTSASTKKSGLASTADATSLGYAALLATGGLGLVFAGRKRR